MRIALVISSLRTGGAERVATTMANHWSRRGEDVVLMTFEECGAESLYQLDSRITVRQLGLNAVSGSVLQAIRHNWRRVRALRSEFSRVQPDVVISFMSSTNVLVLLAGVGQRAVVVVTEHTDPYLSKIGIPWAVLRYATYRRASEIVVLNERAARYFSWTRRVAVLPNPVTIEPVEEGAVKGRGILRQVVAMGSFREEKGFDVLLGAFARTRKKYPEWELVLLGDGSLRPSLEQLRHDLGLDGCVSMPGVVRRPSLHLARAGIFVVSSWREGFPMALCEAMACGLAVISTEYHEGVRDIVEHGVNGLLVPPGSEHALAQAMELLMSDVRMRETLGERAREIAKRYGSEVVMDAWDKKLAGLLVGNRRAAA